MYIYYQYVGLTFVHFCPFRLLSVLAVQKRIQVVDVTSAGKAVQEKKSNADQLSKSKAKASTAAGKVLDDDGNEILTDTTQSEQVSLPKTLTQLEVRVPTEDKDIFAYYYLLKNTGRTLVFVNSIKTAR